MKATTMDFDFFHSLFLLRCHGAVKQEAGVRSQETEMKPQRTQRKSTLIADGILIDPDIGLHRKANLLIEDGVITTITSSVPSADGIIDATGCFVCPGFVDMHVHLREPGFEHKETIETGLQAAVQGGFTAVGVMPNTNPVCDSPQTLKYILDRAKEVGLAEVLPICSITRESRGRELSPMVQLASMTCRAFSNDGHPVEDSDTMLRAMKMVKELNGIIIDHCEDPSLVRNGVMHECPHAGKWGMTGITSLAEEVHIARDILLSEESGCDVHIAHLSTARGVDLVRWAKKSGVPVTAEATPHHFTLAVEDMPGPDPDFKMNPPLRSPEDRQAILQGLQDGTIDVISTDHAPHTAEEKGVGFLKAPFGIIGLETAVPLIMDRLYHGHILSINQIVSACSIQPARLMGASPRTLRPGAAAFITVVDPHQETVVRKEKFASKSRNTPFEAWRLRGAARATIIREIVIRNRS